MNKKGFTVFELLFLLVAVILIAILTIPNALEIIDNNTAKALKEVKTSYEHAALKYMMNNEELFPKEIGDTYEIKYYDLKEANILPKKDRCIGYILVTKLDENNYDYDPNLNCYNDIKDTYNDKLLAHYKLDATTHDYSPNNHHGLNKGATPTTNRFNEENKAMFFSKEAYISLGQRDFVNKEFTVSLWFKILEKPTEEATLIKDGHQSKIDSWILGFRSENEIIFGYGIPNILGPRYTLEETNLNKWTHIVATVTEDTQTIYIDGIIANETKITNTKTKSNNSNIEIGTNFSGYIDDILIYERTLSDREIYALYTLQK
jgi:type II secretory pathway pseudopilin PulG